MKPSDLSQIPKAPFSDAFYWATRDPTRLAFVMLEDTKTGHCKVYSSQSPRAVISAISWACARDHSIIPAIEEVLKDLKEEYTEEQTCQKFLDDQDEFYKLLNYEC